MINVICFGEVLIDFLNSSTHKEDDISLNCFTQYPGGAPANAAVAVSKLGGNALFAGQVGNDPFGMFLKQTLTHYKVDTSLLSVHRYAQTPLAFVFLDEHKERTFAFRRDNTADLVMDETQISPSWFDSPAILHYCSNTLTEAPITQCTDKIVKLATKAESLVSFDVNLRHNLWLAEQADPKKVNEFVCKSHLVKFTRDEFDYLSNGHKDKYLTNCFSTSVLVILITDGAGDMSIHTRHHHFKVSPPSTNVIDTTGGGDAFIGAVLYGLSIQHQPRKCLTNVDKLLQLVQFATYCGAHTVSKKGAFPALPTFKDVQHAWKLP